MDKNTYWEHIYEVTAPYRDKYSNDLLDTIEIYAFNYYCIDLRVENFDDFWNDELESGRWTDISNEVVYLTPSEGRELFEIYNKLIDRMYELRYEPFQPIINKYKALYPQTLLEAFASYASTEYNVYDEYDDKYLIKDGMELVHVLDILFKVCDEHQISTSTAREWFEVYTEFVKFYQQLEA